MNLQVLLQEAQASRVQSLDLVSLEGGFYLLSVQAQGRSQVLRDEHGAVIHVRSVEHARDLLSEVPVVPMYLVHSSAYDEMCGLASGTREPLRVAVGMRSAW
ncbi:DUF6482 family protein [Stutzerimonas chloritidismutans]|uniref:DUF6482 family protein n=1 Tax=Stutzerimonas chloritidismutans TaxID=203192 RepID=UPI003F177ED2